VDTHLAGMFHLSLKLKHATSHYQLWYTFGLGLLSLHKLLFKVWLADLWSDR